MSIYGYKDDHGDHVTIHRYNDKAEIRINEGRGGLAIAFPDHEAPAVALAILTAAGANASITPQEWADPREGAAYYLAEWVSDRAEEKARRAAEDGRIREWLEAVYPGSSCAAGCDEPISDKVRERFRRSRDFFTDIPF